MINDLVSVIIPVYNIEKYIKNIVEAIINQSYKNLELILVDDGGKDQSIKVAEDILSKSNLNYRVIHQENRGLSSARNTGIKNANGEWIICPDGDDYIDKSTIERLLKAAKEKQADLAFCRFKTVKEINIIQQSTWDNGDSIISQEEMKHSFMTREIPIIVPGILFRKNIFNNLLFDENCPYAEDILFIWRLIYQVDYAVYINSDLYNYLTRESSIITSLRANNYIKSIKSFEKMVHELSKNYAIKDKYISMILPKFVLASSHVLAKCNSYKEFKKAVKQVDYRKDMLKLLAMRDTRLACFTILFCISLRLYYQVAKTI